MYAIIMIYALRQNHSCFDAFRLSDEKWCHYSIYQLSHSIGSIQSAISQAVVDQFYWSARYYTRIPFCKYVVNSIIFVHWFFDSLDFVRKLPAVLCSRLRRLLFFMTSYFMLQSLHNNIKPITYEDDNIPNVNTRHVRIFRP